MGDAAMSDAAKSGDVREDDARSHGRTNLYLGAVLSGPDFSAAVTVRNLSQSGALLETPSAPEAGSPVMLVRGALRATGEVVWTKAGQCGIRFNGSVNIAEWLPRSANQAQQRVDQVVQLVRAGVVPFQPAQTKKTDRRIVSKTVAQDLRAVASMLEQLGDSLASDAGLVSQHPEIQRIDIAAQLLTAAADMLGVNPGEAAENKLATLRVSMNYALGR